MRRWRPIQNEIITHAQHSWELHQIAIIMLINKRLYKHLHSDEDAQVYTYDVASEYELE